nr:MAG TPA: hypothetical protein [Caudoviricetes sp.]
MREVGLYILPIYNRRATSLNYVSIIKSVVSTHS